MNLSPYAKKTARTLLRANRKNSVSWRMIEKHGYIEDDVIVQPGIAHGTLCRFAKSKGAWMPKDVEQLKLLGIYREKQPRPKMIADMSTDELRYCLNHRKPLIVTHSKRALAEFVHACHIASKARKASAA